MKLATYPIRIGCFAALMLVAPSVRGADLTITPSNIPDVSLMAFDSAKVDSRFIELFKQRGNTWNYFRPYVAVLSVQPATSVKAITIAWTVTDSAGQAKTTYSCEQSFFLGQQPPITVGANSQLLLMPSGVMTVGSASGGRGPTIKVPLNPQIDEFGRAAKVSVEIDVVIFQDGRVVGPDRSRTVKNLEIRDATARTFVKRARDTVEAGGDLAGLFTTLVAGSRTLPIEADWPAQINASVSEKESDLPAFWIARHARASQQAAAPMQGIERIGQIPPLPKFFRDATK